MIGKISVFDMKSNDKTIDIVHRLEKDDSMVRLMEK